MSKKVQVIILEESYSLLTDESEQHIGQAEMLVNAAVRSIRLAGVSDKKSIAVLASLQLASELIKMQLERQESADSQERLLQMVEQAATDNNLL